ncbi:MAG: N-acetyltransferase [Chloroflexota bacterium]|nr:MAG: N-acetyltransferase [Chloroflexota bacterium]
MVLTEGVEITGQIVVLRELRRSDLDAMATWPRFVEPELQWANLDLATERDRDAWYERNQGTLNRRRFTIWSRDGRALGTIGLRNIDFRYGEGTLGIIINAGDVSRGVGGDAIATLIRYAFEGLGLRKMYLDVAEGNDRARRCYDRVGFTQIGQHRGTDGITYIDMVLHRDRFIAMSAGQN